MLKNMIMISLAFVNVAHADEEGECTGGLCGTPEESGGGGGGGGSVLIANTDQGDTQQFADDLMRMGWRMTSITAHGPLTQIRWM